MGVNKDRGVFDYSVPVNVDAVLYPGNAVSLNSSGEAIIYPGSGVLFGLNLTDKNSYRNQCWGEFGSWGANKVNVVKKGYVTIEPNTYDLTTGDGTTTIYPYDITATYAVNDRVYANASGQITNSTDLIVTELINGVSQMTNYAGRVIVPPSSANGYKMTLDLNID